jgi:hypothetical protein
MREARLGCVSVRQSSTPLTSGRSPAVTPAMISVSKSPAHGSAPVTTCHASTPKLYTSALLLTSAPPFFFLRKSSGALYCSVPLPPAEFEKEASLAEVARPKSVIEGLSSSPSRMFSGFKSR